MVEVVETPFFFKLSDFEEPVYPLEGCEGSMTYQDFDSQLGPLTVAAYFS